MFGYNNYGYNMPNVNPYYYNSYGECPSGHSPDSNAMNINKSSFDEYAKLLNEIHTQPTYNGNNNAVNNQQQYSYSHYQQQQYIQPQYQQVNNMYNYYQPQQQQETNAYLNYLQQNNGYSYNPNQYVQQNQQMAYQQPQMQQQETNPYLRYQQEQYYAQQQYQNQMMNNYYQQQAATDPLRNVVTDTLDGTNPAPYVPGRIHPVELEDTDGNVVKDPARVYNQGGTWINQGGFNPITGNTNRMVGSTGYNLLHNNPVGPNSPNPYYNPNYYHFANLQNPLMGSNIHAQNYTPYLAPYGYVNGYPQNEFDVYLNSVLYNMEPEPMMDVNKMLRNVVLSDEEKEKVNHNNSGYIIGYNYYGQPLYNNYNANAAYQEAFNEQRRRYQEHFTKLSRICHAYYGETIDEEKMMERWDPVPKANNVNQQKIFNIYTATPEEKEKYYEEARVAKAQEICRLGEKQKAYEELVRQQKEQMFAKIKASHDAMIGVKPGEHYSLSQYMDNGYKILVANTMEKARQANRSANNKYDTAGYKNSIRTNPTVPQSSKDEQFVSVEDCMRAVYSRNKNTFNANGNTVGVLSPGVKSEPPAESLYIGNGQIKYTSATDPNMDFNAMFRNVYDKEKNSKYEQEFNNLVNQKKINDDAKRRSGYHG